MRTIFYSLIAVCIMALGCSKTDKVNPSTVTTKDNTSKDTAAFFNLYGASARQNVTCKVVLFDEHDTQVQKWDTIINFPAGYTSTMSPYSVILKTPGVPKSGKYRSEISAISQQSTGHVYPGALVNISFYKNGSYILFDGTAYIDMDSY